MSNGFLFLPAEGDPLLLVKKIYSPEPGRRSPLERIELLPSAGRLAETLRYHEIGIPERLGLEMDVLPASNLLGFLKSNSSGRRPWTLARPSGARGRSNRLLKLPR